MVTRMEPNKKIVVIDDEPSVQEVVRGYLERDGYLVYVAGSGTEGLALAERAKPGLIVLDLMLPDVSGEEICRETADCERFSVSPAWVKEPASATAWKILSLSQSIMD